MSASPAAVPTTEPSPQAPAPFVPGAAPPAPDVRARFQAARDGGLRARDAARSLGLSEGAAIAAHAGHHAAALRAVPLAGPWLALLQALEPCGPLMALTRNDSTVHEKTGVYRDISGTGPMGLALGAEIDLRLFFNRWHAGFAVTEPGRDAAAPPVTSLQFYDAHGLAMHKIYPRDATDLGAFAAVVARFAQPSAGYVFTPASAPAAPAPDASIDAAGFADAWAAMHDTHDFFGVLRRFGVERQQGFRLVEGRFTRRATADAVRGLLQAAAADGTPIMVFVGSGGCIQIHTGPVQRIVPMESGAVRWINVLDVGFNLHLREDRIAQVWIVEKPTGDGTVTSVEAFDAEGELMAMFFGARKPGQAERAEWRAIVAGLERAG
ncbi:hemin-degrading factor [Xylophilus sp. Leaf220]|uniref:hemin-degrading factor n=1 Tax=Xylophilus sp. Leaf220 TaxID=1735686 RepID=UPI0009E977E7|nr:ChuX/HutX family heme-like substrate-binding protein [Xylophilus sp. Leaf220]